MHGTWLRLVCILCSFCLARPDPRDFLTCPDGCECDTTVKLRIKCSGNHWTEENVREIVKQPYMKHILQLDLSKNQITQLDEDLLRLPSLKKLNISENLIRNVEKGAFRGVPGLVNLDLSFNQLRNVSRTVFADLPSLERLKLRGNLLNRLEKFVFDDLKQLKALDLSENAWNCDCGLAWLPGWAKMNGIKLQPAGKCETPEIFGGASLRRFEPPCVDVGSLELTPSHDQIVFAGDELTLRCRGVGADVEHVEWAWPVEGAEVAVEGKTKMAHGLVESTVRIARLGPKHTGEWVCHQLSPVRNDSASVSVLVLSDATHYCPATVTRDNRGVYYWPRSIAGNEVELECAADGRSAATYTCNNNGQWEELNTTPCPYISERTRVLERLSRENLTMADPLTAKASLLLNLTRNIDTWTEPMDLYYVAQTINDTCGRATISGDDRALYLYDTLVEMLRVPKTMMTHQAARQIRECAQRLGHVTGPAQPQMAVESLPVAPDAFNGLSCVWEGSPPALRCSAGVYDTPGRAILDSPGHDGVKAAFDLPPSLFKNTPPPDPNIHLWINMFSSSTFFPDVSDNVYVSPIVGVDTADFGPVNLADQVTVTIKFNPRFSAGLTPVIWDEGRNIWIHDGCATDYISRDLFFFHCQRLGYYALRQDVASFQRTGRTTFGDAVLYSGSCVLLICLLVTLLTYVFCNTAVQMSRRTKHALANTWLSIFLLCFLFSFGVLETADVKLCEIIGLGLHYFSLTTLLWILVSVNHMQKRLAKKERPADELPPGAPAQKPILGIYLVGWGIGLIVCGISGAVHLRDYAQAQYCFLGAGPALSGLLVPAGVLAVLLCGFFLTAFCAIRNNDINGQLSDGTQGTEHVDLELLGEGIADGVSNRSVLTDSEDVEDPEHGPLIQLKAHFIVLVLYAMGWCCAAVGVRQHETIAYALYAVVCFALGVFILYFYCVARSDVRNSWRCCRSRSVSDARPAAGSVASVSSSNRAKAVIELNNCDAAGPPPDSAANSMNLVAMHRQVYRSNNSMPTYQEIGNLTTADAFYNPRQIIVARKFFRRQRRHRRNELGMRRRGDGGAGSEGEPWRPSAESAVFLSSDMENNSELLLRCGSKINNLNIHKEQQQQDDKLLRLVIGADAAAVADVQLQCSLDDSSDSFCHKIDSLKLPHYVAVVDPTYGVVKVQAQQRRPRSQIYVADDSPKRSLRRSLSLSPKHRKAKFKKETSV